MNKIVSDRKTGRAARLTTFYNRWTIETWWDRRSRVFFTQVKDGDGHEHDARDLMMFGSGLNAGTIAGATWNHDELMKYFLKCF